MRSVEHVGQWPVEHAATAVVGRDGTVLGTHGDVDRVFPLASVTKLLTAYAVLIAVEEGAFELDDPAGPEGSTIGHLLAHASGLDFDAERVRAEPGRRRIYSNAGFKVLARTLTERSGFDFGAYLTAAVLEPLQMTSTVPGTPWAGVRSSVADLSRFAAELQSPFLLDPRTHATATSVAFPGLDGVLPGFGRQRPNDWGLGFEIRDGKEPHWTGTNCSAATYGHFGQSGTLLWVDPETGVACIALTDRDFGDWAARVWPAYADAVLAEVADRPSERR